MGRTIAEAPRPIDGVANTLAAAGDPLGIPTSQTLHRQPRLHRAAPVFPLAARAFPLAARAFNFAFSRDRRLQPQS